MLKTRALTPEQVEEHLGRAWPDVTFRVEDGECTWEDGPSVARAARWMEENLGAKVVEIGNDHWALSIKGTGIVEARRDLRDETCALLVLRAAGAGIEMPRSGSDFAQGTFAKLVRHTLSDDLGAAQGLPQGEVEEVLLVLVLDQADLTGLAAYNKLKTLGRIVAETGYDSLLEMAQLATGGRE